MHTNLHRPLIEARQADLARATRHEADRSTIARDSSGVDGPQQKPRFAAVRMSLAALGCVAVTCLASPALGAAATYCSTPSVPYAGQGNFFNVFHETLSAEVCHDGYHNPWVIWTSHRFSGAPGWSGAELGRGVFWDPGRYGGSTTIWSDDADTFGWGPASYTEDTYLRIWVTRSGQTYTYGGL